MKVLEQMLAIKNSKYDFDKQIQKLGFEVAERQFLNRTTFEKTLSNRIKLIVQRPDEFDSTLKLMYDFYSAYAVKLVYLDSTFADPIRKVKWGTFALSHTIEMIQKIEQEAYELIEIFKTHDSAK